MSTQPDNRYVDTTPYDPDAALQELERKDLDAPNWVLIWRKFKTHKLGLTSGVFLLVCYLLLPVIGFIAPYGPNERDSEHIYSPPQSINLFHEGSLRAPFIYPMTSEADLETFQWVFKPDLENPQSLRYFCEGATYKIAGLIPSNTHLFCAPEGATLFIWGSDRLGRDVFSRILYGAQLSLTVGLIGITVSFILGIFFGSLAGYFGGKLDWMINRMIEILRSLPELPLWLALSAAVPSNWSPVAVFFVISIILGILDWPGLARSVRAKFLSLREEEYVRAAEMMGASSGRVIRKHLLPNFMSHLIASAALSIPAMILGETALSFLGLGLRAPAVSWGVMLNDAQNLASIEIYPWTAIPMLPIIVVVLAFNFLGDGLRDSLDPYQQ
ncbi:ABC transporter permease [Phaeobacter inhibens]|uniref:ABC transporter permease n=1 Tax=Phaeobacter inhibens TaxID=221822 RepID=UPI0001633275|nr:ABC transporter permease [Phaeobacter inhibens]AFO90176.1 putative glutathione transport system permease protein GsiD [Phaeobacter inhibens DSM 17395]AUQ44813.1 putative glutathione transport system permease protein GsiD [Phaeobacter inhibens]AXT21717.1 ABC transporter permease [Phaeobacter inhibens]UWR53426.1 ABC transporter permease [Phaeobacter inhibens]UWR68988.1 ABC transporter permease [Phaeobacter inhibens]